VFNGVGWRYVDDPDYILYSSLDYDSSGVDTTGANLNDWPIRWVNGHREYVSNPLARPSYRPAVVSDEDLFCIYKDTDTRADQWYTGPEGPSIPIGVEVQNSVYTWGSGPGKDIVLFQYDVINKSGVPLDSCYLFFGYSLRYNGTGLYAWGLTRELRRYQLDPSRNLAYMRATDPSQWLAGWSATPIPPTLGFVVLESPLGYDSEPCGMTRIETVGRSLMFQRPSPDTSYYWLDQDGNDSIAYRTMSRLPYSGPGEEPYPDGPVVLTGAFPMAVGQSVRVIFGLMFSDSLPHLLQMDDYLRRSYQSGFQRPIPPNPPRLTVRGLNRGALLSWDRSSESSTDPIIPSTLGRPFVGYRLQRAAAVEGPYLDIGRWSLDSGMVHEYLDRGSEIGGLKNNVRYYYRLLSFDEGVHALKLEPMYSLAVAGVNAISVVPTTDPSDETAHGSTGELSVGTLGDLTTPVIVPTNVTNYNNIFSGRELTLSITTVTDGARYMIPITIKDTLSGRVHNAVLDPGLTVHGSPETAGIKEGHKVIDDVFGVGGANVELSYRFEQLADSFHVRSSISSTYGADVPVILSDARSVTGIQQITPFTTARREVRVEFLPGGLDTLAGLFGIILPYLNVRVVEVETGHVYEPGVDWRLSSRVVRREGGGASTSGKNYRYYISGAVPNGTVYDAGHLLTLYNTAVAFDFTDHGEGSGKPTPQFSWGSPHRAGTIEFAAGDAVLLTWEGGARGNYPQDAVVKIVGAEPGRAEVTDAMMEGIRIVPNPYVVTHEAQRGVPRLYFNYLPEECTIRIYTLALDKVRTLYHSGGSREEWDLETEGGQLVASQLLLAHIEAPNGRKVVKKFSVVVGR
jgi:hypothetical protein